MVGVAGQAPTDRFTDIRGYFNRATTLAAATIGNFFERNCALASTGFELAPFLFRVPPLTAPNIIHLCPFRIFILLILSSYSFEISI